MQKEPCNAAGCRPDVAFRGYSKQDQLALAETLSWGYTYMDFNVITKSNLPVIQKYRYECNSSARGMWGERRFFGLYQSDPSHHLTVVGLRLIGGELRIYRIAREFAFHNAQEYKEIQSELDNVYGKHILFYPYISSNAYSEVMAQQKDGWFARSSPFSSPDPSDDRAEVVLIDPATRNLLEPTNMPESGEIEPLPVQIPAACASPIHIQ